MMRCIVINACGLLLALGFSAGSPMAALRAQRFRISGTTVSYYFELRPVLEDSIPDSLTTGDGVVRQSPVGTVGCPEANTQCYF